jgi:2-succinyl-5-enolpyruvyl-6-hydroxy-3-cyclohexene-1-carboxylate synthase
MSPVVIITTSGTAVGNLLPAVMEAHHAGLPLILLTADRPGELRGVGANQTTDQVGIFGTFVRLSTDVAAPEAQERGGRATRIVARAVRSSMGDLDRDDMTSSPGPVHLDVEFREPLTSDGGAWPQIVQEEASVLERARNRLRAVGMPARHLPAVVRGVVIAGDGAGDVARQVAEAHGWPLLAEPTSGARTGSHAVAPYVAMLTGRDGVALAQRISQVVVIGRPTLSRVIHRVIHEAPALYVAGHGARWREAPLHAERVLARVPPEWLERSQSTIARDREDAGARASRKRGEGVEAEAQLSWLDQWLLAASDVDSAEATWDALGIAQVVVESLAADDVAVLGSSGPIRAVDHVAPVWNPDAVPTLIANRGLSGIDGTIATASGVALACNQPVTALMGDVTFLHDAGSLLVGPLERKPDLRIVVVNDGGGTIFASLEHSAAPAEHVERVFTTPHGADFAGLCAGYGARHRVLTSLADLRKALATPVAGVEVLEARVGQ